MHILIWTLTLLGLALWSLLAWGTHALLTLDPSWVGSLKPLVDKLPSADVIEAWAPGWRAMLLAMADLTQSLLGWVGSAAGWIVGSVWALGALALIVLGALLSAGVGLGRRAARLAAQKTAAA